MEKDYLFPFLILMYQTPFNGVREFQKRVVAGLLSFSRPPFYFDSFSQVFRVGLGFHFVLLISFFNLIIEKYKDIFKYN